MLGYLYGKRFGSKIATANRKEGDKVGAGPSSETGCVILHTFLPMKLEQTECSKTLAHKIHMPGNYPEESIQHYWYVQRLNFTLPRVRQLSLQASTGTDEYQRNNPSPGWVLDWNLNNKKEQ